MFLRIQKYLSLLTLCALTLAARAEIPVLYGDIGAHDPSTMIKSGGRYYVFYTSQGLESKSSTDLRNWTYRGDNQRIFPGNPPAWTTNAVAGFTGFFWAPDVAYFNGTYHVYYSISTWGTIDSAIGLVTSPSLDSPTWTDQGKVVQSDAVGNTQPETDTTSINCIDPSILVDTNGTVWMSYGSYSDGIMVTQIDPATGKRLNPASAGTKIASSSASFFSNTTEASCLHQHGGYYYLFLNYGGCCSGVDSTYNIRIGRSTSVTGPYLDRNGVNMLNGGGTVLLASTGRFIGPGHAGVCVDNGTNWLTFHYYDGTGNGSPTLGLTRFDWTADGWPAVTNDWSAFYPFDMDATDHRGVYSGTLQSGAGITNDAGRGKVLQLDGITNYVRLADAVANASTFMTWVKWNGGNDWQRIFDFGVDTTKYLFLTPRAFGGRMRFAIKNGGGEQTLDAPDALPTNTWVHVAVTVDGSRGVLYQNGLPVATNSTMTILPWQLLCRTNYLGKSQYPTDPLFSGEIDSFRIFGRALSAGEIQNLAATPGALAHRYSFTTDARDSVGMAHGTLLGDAAITNGALKLTGTSGGAVELPHGFGGLVGNCSAVTFEFWATFSVNANWARVFDFGASVGGFGSQYVFFSPHTSFGSQRFEISTGAGTFTSDPTPALDNRSVHVVCILDPSNHYAAIYTNGVLEMTASAALPPLSGVSSDYAYLGRSLFSSDGWLNGTIDEFRIYDGRLTPAEITADFIAGPGQVLPGVPTGLAATAANAQVALNWNAVSNATSYRVKRSSTSAGPYSVLVTNLTTACTDTGLVNGTIYYYMVSAVNSVGEGANSAWVNARPVSLTSPNVNFVMGGNQLTLSWPADHAGWRLQAQTNGLAAGLNTNWFDVPNSGQTNNLVLPLDATKGSVFYRLVYP